MKQGLFFIFFLASLTWATSSFGDCGRPHGASETSSTPSTGSETGISTTPSTDTGHSVQHQLGVTFNPDAASGSVFDDWRDSVGFGENPLDHQMVRTYLNYVKEVVKLKRSQLRKVEREQKNALKDMERRIQDYRNHSNQRLKQWVDTWDDVDKVEKRIADIGDKLGEIKSERLNNKDLNSDDRAGLGRKEIKLQGELEDAVRDERRAQNKMKNAGDLFEASLKNLNRAVDRFEQMKSDAGVP